MEKSMKHINRVSAVVAAITCAVIVSIAFCGCSSLYASSYTEEEHLQRVEALARERYITDGEPYTDLTVYPLYDANDKLSYFVVELEPYGYVYVKIIPDSRLMHLNWGMYIRCPLEGELTWYKYDIVISHYTKKDGEIIYEKKDVWTELDDEEKPIFYNNSHFKEANISNEKRYLLECKAKFGTSYERGYIPSIRKDDKYLNLITMKEFEYKQDLDLSDFVVAKEVYFIEYPYFKL